MKKYVATYGLGVSNKRTIMAKSNAEARKTAIALYNAPVNKRHLISIICID